ncbi:MAG: heat shock protein HspQ [Bdellovibrionales bacterium]|nr:heat shock protein HspQ [Bdellovibrionales bacterium]
MAGITKAKFALGATVHHKLFGYRGVIIDIDPYFCGSEEWYEQVAHSRPPKDRPWYRVLVHRRGVETYVAERNLESDDSGRPVRHPLIAEFFADFKDGRYEPRIALN